MGQDKRTNIPHQMHYIFNWNSLISIAKNVPVSFYWGRMSYRHQILHTIFRQSVFLALPN